MNLSDLTLLYQKQSNVISTHDWDFDHPQPMIISIWPNDIDYKCKVCGNFLFEAGGYEFKNLSRWH